jgi:hypothetical protein
MSMSRGRKVLNENLAPLRRFLQQRVGRSWDAVRSEICAVIAPRSAVQKHVLDHVAEMVEQNVVMIDGRPHLAAAWGSRRDQRLPVGRHRFYAFYVCPMTRTLRAFRPPKRSRGQ